MAIDPKTFALLTSIQAGTAAAVGFQVAAIVAKKKTLSIGSLEIDAVISEQHSFENEISEHPVHRGADIADHKRRKLRTVTMTGIVSNYPIQFQITAAANAVTGQNKKRAETAWETLQKMAGGEELIDVFTSLGPPYENMVIQSVTCTRDVTSQHHIEFTAVMREFILVSSETSEIPAQRTERGPETNSGTKAGKNEPLRSNAANISNTPLGGGIRP